MDIPHCEGGEMKQYYIKMLGFEITVCADKEATVEHWELIKPILEKQIVEIINMESVGEWWEQ